MTFPAGNPVLDVRPHAEGISVVVGHYAVTIQGRRAVFNIPPGTRFSANQLTTFIASLNVLAEKLDPPEPEDPG